MLSKKVCVVTGAGGTLGPAVVEEFAKAGFIVRATARGRLDARAFPAGTEFFTADILQPESLRAAMGGADTVVHLAALLHVVSPPPSLISEYDRVNVDGTRNVLDAAQECGVRRVIIASTIAVYGSAGGRTANETFRPQPNAPYGISKLRAEALALSYTRPNGEALCTVLRLAAVYGHRMKGNYRRLVHGIARGTFIYVGAGGNRRTLVYVRDAARAAVLAATAAAAAGQIFNVTDREVYTMNEIVAAIAQALGGRRPVLRVPVAPVRAAVRIIEFLYRAVGRPGPTGTAILGKLMEDFAVDGSRIVDRLGFTPQYDLQAGWNETIADMRAQGKL